MYRSLASGLYIFLNKMGSKLLRYGKQGIVITGDFNVHINTEKSETRELAESLNNCLPWPNTKHSIVILVWDHSAHNQSETFQITKKSYKSHLCFEAQV